MGPVNKYSKEEAKDYYNQTEKSEVGGSQGCLVTGVEAVTRNAPDESDIAQANEAERKKRFYSVEKRIHLVLILGTKAFKSVQPNF